MSGRIKVQIQGSRGGFGAAYGGAATVDHALEIRYDDTEVDRIYGAEPTNIEIPAGSTFELDLQTVAAGPDLALNASNVRALLIQADPANAVAITVRPGTLNPWLGAFTTSTSELGLGPGDFVALGGAAFPVSPTSKVLAFENPGVAVQRIRVRILAAQ
jgi:hypothetical protein